VIIIQDLVVFALY